jgi:spectinomycin phosphotransferase
MLEKPDLKDERIIACLKDEYGFLAAQVSFLPIGADQNAAVYRIAANDGARYFLKLRGGDFEETSVSLPKYLSDQGIEQIMAPLTTTTAHLWTSLDAFSVILYPFVEGHNGYEVRLSDRHWREFGTALRSIHTVAVPPALLVCIPLETYTPQWREVVRAFLARVEDDRFDEPVAAKLAGFLRAKRDEILDLVTRAERLAQALQARSDQFVLCHSDMHAGNVLIEDNGAFYIVDWDNPILAPKERDLMFIGGGQGFVGRTAREEEDLFYEGYGQTQIDPIALAYYRYERIVQDIAVFCGQILLKDQGGKDRAQSLQYLMSNFLPNGTIEIARRLDSTRRAF